VISAANAQARSFPSADAYVNSTLYYDYEPGRLYQVQTSPRFLTAIFLRKGEKLLAKASGDTVRWVLGDTVQGAGAGEQVVVLLKPIRAGLCTNLVLTTDQRTYLIEAESHEGPAYTSALAWTYPEAQDQDTPRSRAAPRAGEAPEAARPLDGANPEDVARPALRVEQLNFGYRVESLGGKPPRWQPLRVFDDGLKTYIQFPVDMAATDAPPLFLLDPAHRVELVNYRYQGGYYIVDRLIDVAELRIGESPQTIVRITRSLGRG